MASVFESTLWDWDIFGSPGCIPKRNGILLVETLQYKDDILHCNQLIPSGLSSAHCIHEFPRSEHDQILGRISLLWDCKWNLPSTGEKLFILNADDLHFENPNVNNCDFRVSNDSLPLPIRDISEGPIRVLELFAGGFGGWSTALRALCDQDVRTQVVAVDHCIRACHNFALSHSAILLNGFSHVPIDSFSRSDLNFIVHAEVDSDKWLGAAANWSPECMVFSAPCPPWTHAAHSDGLNSWEGQLMLESLAVAKILRPRVVLIEQVNGFFDHSHKQFFLRQIRWAGFSLHWSRVLDASIHCATTRKRWLAMLIRVGDPFMNAIPFELWPSPKQVFNTGTVGAILGNDLAKDARLFPSEDTLALCSRHDLLPPNRKASVATNHVLESRCSGEESVTPTFMASYGKQHLFDIEYLKDKGLMSHFLSLNGMTRYWHPIEILILHRAIGFHFIPHDWNLAWRLLGNQICVPHALLLLANAFKMMPGRAGRVSVEDAFHNLQKQCLRADQLYYHESVLGHFVSDLPIQLTDSDIKHVMEFDSLLIQDRLKQGHFWTLRSTGPWKGSTSGVDQPLDFVSQASVNDLISPTCPFVPVMKGLIHVYPHPIAFWFAADVTFDDVLKAWEGHFEISMNHSASEEIALHLVPCRVPPLKAHSPELICLYREKMVTLLPDSIANRNMITDGGNMGLFDQFGPVGSKLSFPYLILSSHDPDQDVFPNLSILSMFAAFPQVHCSTSFERESFQFLLIVRGETQQVQLYVDFWHQIADIGIDNFGWRLTVTEQPAEHLPSKVCLCFAPIEGGHPISPAALRVLLTVRAFRTLISGIEQAEGISVTFKWLSRSLKTCKVLPDCALSIFRRIMQIAFLPPFGRLEDDAFRTLNKGRNLTPETTISECDPSQHSGSIVMHFVLSMHGGGGDTGTKAGFQTQVRNSLASTLLQEGYDLAWVSNCIDKLVQGVGVKKLAPIASKPPGSQRLSEILNFVRQTGLTIPTIKPSLSSKASFQHKTKKHVPPPLDARNYKVIEGSIKNEDGTDAAQISDFRAGASGFSLVSPEFAVPWVRANEKISSDELGLLVLGEPVGEFPMDKQPITIPCRDEHDREVLLAVNLYQFGQKKLQLKEFEKHHVKIDSTFQVALTVWREDWNTEWESIAKNVNQFVRSVLQQDDAIVATWGRSFRKGRNTTTPNDATSCQLHCSVKETHLARFLQCTGQNLIWATPKSPEGRPSTQFRLIWLPIEMDFPEAVVLGAKIRGALGLHRSKGRLALRIGKSDFATAWSEIYPHLEPPLDVEAVHIYKLEVLPFGTTAVSLQEWAKCVKWTIKPFRALGPRTWLIGTPEKPPHSLHFNGSPILASLMPGRSQHVQSPLVAGPKPNNNSKTPSQPVAQALNSDRWAMWTGPRLQSHPTAVAPRAVSGPVETQLNQQSERMDKLEAALGTLQQSQAKQSEDIKRTEAQVKKSDSDIRQHLDNRLTEVRRELDQSFTAAIQQQSKTFDSNLHDIKRLLLQPKRKSDHTDMED